MNIGKWLTESQKQLEKADITTARLDCLVLLQDALNRDKATILAHQDEEIDKKTLLKLAGQLKQRAEHTPLSYIRGRTEFYGREFIINKDVLEPRPESETMIDLLKKLPAPKHILDVGTGSGALAITAKLELPKVTVSGVDIDPTCLSVARQNAQRRDLRITLTKSDLLKAVSVKTDTILLCNLPYVPEKFTLNQAAMNEPKVAIFGGVDGLDLYRNLFKQLDAHKEKPTHILTESLPFQHARLAKIALKSGYQQTTEEDFIQVFKVT